jgi:hypothetical protein
VRSKLASEPSILGHKAQQATPDRPEGGATVEPEDVSAQVEFQF